MFQEQEYRKVTMGTDNGDKKPNVEGKFQPNGMPDMSGEKSGGFMPVCASASTCSMREGGDAYVTPKSGSRDFYRPER